MPSIQDRWVRKDKTRTDRYGQGLRYLVEWVEPGGVRRRKSFASKDAAKAQVNTLNAQLYTGVYVAPKETVLLRDYAAKWEAQQIHQRASSRAQIAARLRINILPTLGDVPLEQLTRQDVQDAVIGWSNTLAPSTVKLTYTYLSGMLKAAALDGVIRSSPCIGIRLPRAEKERVRPLTTELVQRIEQEVWAPYKPLVVFCAATGMRGSEMAGLTWDRVDLQKGLVTVDRQLISRDSSRPVWGPPKTQFEHQDHRDRRRHHRPAQRAQRTAGSLGPGIPQRGQGIPPRAPVRSMEERPRHPAGDRNGMASTPPLRGQPMDQRGDVTGGGSA